MMRLGIITVAALILGFAVPTASVAGPEFLTYEG
jgi:hypothetical protein